MRAGHTCLRGKAERPVRLSWSTLRGTARAAPSAAVFGASARRSERRKNRMLEPGAAAMGRSAISIGEELATVFDALIRERGYTTRSAAFRDTLRGHPQRRRAGRDISGPCVASLSCVYNHHERNGRDGRAPGSMPDAISRCRRCTHTATMRNASRPRYSRGWPTTSGISRQASSPSTGSATESSIRSGLSAAAALGTAARRIGILGRGTRFRAATS